MKDTIYDLVHPLPRWASGIHIVKKQRKASTPVSLCKNAQLSIGIVLSVGTMPEAPWCSVWRRSLVTGESWPRLWELGHHPLLQPQDKEGLSAEFPLRLSKLRIQLVSMRMWV